MAGITKEGLVDIIKEVAGPIIAEQMRESQAKGAEKLQEDSPVAQFASLAGQAEFLKEMQRSGAAFAPNGVGWATQKAGDRFFRTMGALQAGDGDQEAALKWVKNGADGRGSFKANMQVLEKDLSSVIQNQGAILVREELSDDFIEFLRPAIVLTALGARDIPMQSTELSIPAHVIGSTGGWIGEGEPVPVTAPGFGAVQMRLHTYGSLVPIPNDLLRYAFNNAEAFVAGDMRLDIAQAMDLADLRGSGVNGQPLGVRWRGRVTRSLGDTTDNIINDLVGCFTRAGESSMAMQRMGWGLNWRVWQRLYTIRDGIGGFLFKEEMSNGTLMGQPFRRSAIFKSNLDPYGTTVFNKTELFWFDLDTVMVARGDGVLLYVSQDGAYESGGVVKSALSRNQTVIRALIKNDVNIRYRDGVQIVDGINWIN